MNQQNKVRILEMKVAAETATSHSLKHEAKIKFGNRNYEYVIR